MSYFKTLTRKLLRLFSGQSGTDSKANRNSHDLEIFEAYHRDYYSLPGWFIKGAAVLWDCLLSFQNQQAINGNFLEIGCWKGKSATCSTMFAADDEYCVFSDRIILPELKDSLSQIRKTKNLFVEGLSSELASNKQFAELGSNFRWIHIDGEHSGEAITQDLSLAHEMLGELGIISVDDVPSAAYPQLFYAVVEYLSKNPDLTMFACGHNKIYLCRKSAAPTYLHYIRDHLHSEMKRRDFDATIWKSGRPGDLNSFGITNRQGNYDYRGPDWDPLKIEC